MKIKKWRKYRGASFYFPFYQGSITEIIPRGKDDDKDSCFFLVGLISPDAISNCVGSTRSEVFIPEYGEYVSYEQAGENIIFEGDIIVDNYCSQNKPKRTRIDCAIAAILSSC